MSCARYCLISIVISTIIAGTVQADVADLGWVNEMNDWSQTKWSSHWHIFAYRDNKRCKTLNDAFITSLDQFTGCVLRHNNKDTSYCYSCVILYNTMVNKYTAFANGFTNVTTNNVTCRSIYFDINPLNIVDTVYKNGLQLWDIAFCKGKLIFFDLIRTNNKTYLLLFASFLCYSSLEQIASIAAVNGVIWKRIVGNQQQPSNSRNCMKIQLPA